MCQKTETPCKTRLENERLKQENAELRGRLTYCQNKLIPMQSELLKHLQGEQTVNETINHLTEIAKK